VWQGIPLHPAAVGGKPSAEPTGTLRVAKVPSGLRTLKKVRKFVFHRRTSDIIEYSVALVVFGNSNGCKQERRQNNQIGGEFFPFCRERVTAFYAKMADSLCLLTKVLTSSNHLKSETSQNAMC